MKLLVLAVFSSVALSAHAVCDDHFDACQDVHDIATITCSATKAAECSIANGEGAPDEALDYLLGEPKIQTIDADVCRKKCKEQADQADIEQSENKCEFFRLEKGHANIQCALQTTCGEGDQYCGKPDCITGQLGCDDEGNEIMDCSLTEKTPWDSSKFHIICTDIHHGDINIYGANITLESIPGGTICSTVRMCDDWKETETETDAYYRKLAVFCDGHDGTWKPRNNTGSAAQSAAMVAGENKIAEPECLTKCDPLTLTKYAEQDWADLICDSLLSDGNILEEPNSCILLCDNHLKMSVDCGFTGMGEKHWHDSHGALLDDGKIVCDA